MSAVTFLLDTQAARRSLQEQIARLERELAETLATTYPPVECRTTIGGCGPRLLDLRRLELTRDALFAAVTEVRRRAQARAQQQAEARATLSAMRADPNAYKGQTVSNQELGLPGCTVYAVRPRLFSRWWRVKVSSGCP